MGRGAVWGGKSEITSLGRIQHARSVILGHAARILLIHPPTRGSWCTPIGSDRDFTCAARKDKGFRSSTRRKARTVETSPRWKEIFRYMYGSILYMI